MQRPETSSETQVRKTLLVNSKSEKDQDNLEPIRTACGCQGRKRRNIECI